MFNKNTPVCTNTYTRTPKIQSNINIHRVYIPKKDNNLINRSKDIQFSLKPRETETETERENGETEAAKISKFAQFYILNNLRHN